MSNSMFCFPNWADGSDSVTPVYTGGSWDAVQSLDKLSMDDVNDPAVSSSTDIADTQFEIDLGVIRDCRAFVISNHNISNDGMIYIEASDTPQFAGATVGANASGGATTITVMAGTFDLDILDDIFLTIAGQSTKYKVVSGNYISAGTSDVIDISPALTGAITEGQVITCRSGNYDSPVYQSPALELAVGRIYQQFSLFWGHPSLWTGQPTREDRKSIKVPIVRTFPTLLARYWRFYVEDTGNEDGYVRLDRLFTARGVQPSYNLIYGQTSLGFLSNTKVKTTNSKRRLYQPKRNQRLMPFEIQNLPTREAFSSFFDMQGNLDIHKQLFFIFDPEDIELMHRRAFLATIRELNPLQFPYFDVNNVPLELIEVI